MHIPITLESIFLDIFLPFTIACIVNILLFYLIQLLTDPDFDELLPKTCAGKAFDDEDLVIKIEDLPYLEDKAKLEVNVENSGIQEKSKKLNTQKSNTEKYVLKHSFKNTDLKSKLLNSFKNDVARTHSWPIQQPLQQPTPTPSCSVQNSRNNSDIYLNTGVHANNSNHMPASINNSDINTSENNTCNSIQSISKFQDQQLLQTIKSRPRRLALSSNNPRQTLLSTKIWTQLVVDFRKSMQEKSRKLWVKPVPYRFYSMVFTGQDAVDWAEQYLCILRIQLGSKMGKASVNVQAGALALNRKLLQCFVMTSVSSDRVFVNNSYHYYTSFHCLVENWNNQSNFKFILF